MPNQFLSDEFGDIEDYFITDYQLIDQYIGDTLWSWGDNTSGQLGVNNTTTRSTPVTTLLGGTNWKSIACGNQYTVALKTDGTLWSWGDNTSGQLGVNNTTTRSTPVTTLLGGTNWKSIACGTNHIVAIKTDGTLWSWGDNTSGQLGVNNTTTRSTPVTTLLGGTNWKSIACGNFHTVALKTDGTLWSWGDNSDGQLGVNDKTLNIQRSTPVTTLLGGTNWKSIACGNSNILSLKTDGTLWAWGGNANGQLGNGNTTDILTPSTTLLGGTNWKSITGGQSHTIALKTDGTLWAWGGNISGQLGVNDNTQRNTPVTTLLGGTNWKSIDSGNIYTVALKTDGTLWSWGRNNFGQLGVNNNTDRSTPVTTLLGGNNWKSISGRGSLVAALTAGQSVDFR
jgi:alpha-tubulin suppressor-like RCC1 family protein